jgi:hypothetical protein
VRRTTANMDPLLTTPHSTKTTCGLVLAPNRFELAPNGEHENICRYYTVVHE